MEIHADMNEMQGCISSKEIIFFIWFYIPFNFLFEVWLIYDIILASDVQHSDSIFLCIICHLKLLQKIFPCAVQYVLGAYVFYTYYFVPFKPLPMTHLFHVLSPHW